MTLRISTIKEFSFEAAHNLPGMGKCARNHGHSYRCQIAVSGNMTKDGIVINFSDLSSICRGIEDMLDHEDLNNVLNELPTAENIAAWIAEKASDELRKINYNKSLHVISVKLWETANSHVYIEFR